jgi:hypothetical protein
MRMNGRAPPELLDRMPPNDRALERAVLGNAIVDWWNPETIKDLEAEDFYHWGYGAIFREIRRQRTRKQDQDIGALLIVALKAEVDGGTLAECIHAAGRQSQWQIRRLRELRIQRERIEAAVALLWLAWTPEKSQWLAQAKTLVAKIERAMREAKP